MMKFLNIAALSALAVLAAAQDNASPTPTLSPQARCAQSCESNTVHIPSLMKNKKKRTGMFAC